MPNDPIGALILVIVPLGVLGVFGVALFERVVPLLPSHGLFAAVGMAAADGLWCLPLAVAASVTGSGTGAIATYKLGRNIGPAMSARLRTVVRRRDLIGRRLRAIRRSNKVPFVAQLLPAVRLLAPIISGAVRYDQRRFLIATVAGVFVWNGTFIVVGFTMARLGATSNATFASLVFIILASAGAGAFHVFKRSRLVAPCSERSSRTSSVIGCRKEVRGFE